MNKIAFVFTLFLATSCSIISEKESKSNIHYDIQSRVRCLCKKGQHSRMCQSILLVSRGDFRDSISIGHYAEPINYCEVSINNKPFLYVENTSMGVYGYTVAVYDFYSLDDDSFMKLSVHKQLVIREEVPRQTNGKYTHYVKEKKVTVSLEDKIEFDICSYTMSCPEATDNCDTLFSDCNLETYLIL